ncbi:helix-turn-helix domain-containing protein [Paenisporosarcina sp. TG20]|uniref:helix-turn-helix domain-containing protein n=1 Tax=Paenisporosarcina sp. TG20 TaxID=1211706 RepID=UPI0003034F5B|nr:helix-turn-helix domain-containing protein [Paenisporosarcina sp. TG20]
MYLTKWQTDEGLWNSALTLIKGQHYTDANEVVKAIAVQTVQSIGGTISIDTFPTHHKQLDEKEILYMQSLSREISELVGRRDKNKVAELATDYIDHFIQLLTENHKEADYLHKQLLKGFIKTQLLESHRKHYKFIRGGKMYANSIFQGLGVESEKGEFVTSTEAAEIGGVSDQTIRRWCEKGKFPEAFKTEGGHWRIPDKYLKMNLQQVRKANAFMKQLDEDTREQLGGDVDEFDLDLDYT